MGREHYLVDVDTKTAIALERGPWDYVVVQELEVEEGPWKGRFTLLDRPSEAAWAMRLRDVEYKRSSPVALALQVAVARRLHAWIASCGSDRIVHCHDEGDAYDDVWDAVFTVVDSVDGELSEPYTMGDYGQGGP